MLVAWCLSASAGVGDPIRPATFILCTPSTVEFLGQPPKQVRNPIVAALEEAAPGSIIKLQAGDYPAFGIGFDKPQHWNARTRGGSAQKPVLVQAQGPVRILPRDGSGDTLSVHQQIPNGYITFEGITFVPAYRAAVMFFSQGNGRVHNGYRFIDCHIEGRFDHAKDRGQPSKWGVWAHSLKNFEWIGQGTRSRIRNLQNEHAFYLQNCRGNVTIENVDCSRVGRTFIQLTARHKDGPPGIGTVIVRNNRVSDTGLSKQDNNHKGGSAFTFAGRHRGLILVENNTYRAGFDPELRHLTKKGVPYGTSAVAAWDAGEQRNGTLVLKDNDFEMADGCGDRPLVAIGGCDEVRIIGTNRFVSGGETDALAFDPLHWDGSGRLLSKPNQRVYMNDEAEIEGKVTVRWKPITDEQREQYAKKPEPRQRRRQAEQRPAKEDS